MPRYIALLRAINVGGHVVKMDKLRALFEEIGFKNVTTFIASGNVLFDSPSKSPATIEKKIEQHLWKALGYEVETFLRTPAELATVAASMPFRGWKHHTDAHALYVGFLKADASREAETRLAALQSKDDEFCVIGRQFFWSSRTGLGQSRVSGAQLNRALGVSTTTRNVTTVRRLAALEE